MLQAYGNNKLCLALLFLFYFLNESLLQLNTFFMILWKQIKSIMYKN